MHLGQGFDRAFRLCAQQGIGYEYQNDEYGFTFVFLRNRNDPQPGRSDDRMNDIIAASQMRKFAELENKILKLINDNPTITISELAKKTGKSEPTVYRYIERMVSMGKLGRVGSRKSGYWNIR